MSDTPTLDFEQVSLEDLERLTRVISLEALSASTFTADVKSRFSSFFGKANSFLTGLRFTALNINNIASGPMVKAVTRYGYVDASNADVIVPQGFIGHWLPYAEALNEATKQAVQLPGLVDRYNVCLGRLISDPDLLRSAAGIPLTGAYEIGVAKSINSIQNEFFQANNEAIERKLGAVLERTGDLPGTYFALNEAIKLDKQNPSSIVIKGVGRSMEIAKKLMHLLDSNEVSKPVREQLTALTYSLAKEVEAYSVLLYRLRQFSLSLEDSAKKLNAE